MERWLAERQTHGEHLHQKAQRTRSQGDITAWERYARQTARMQVAAGRLRTALPDTFFVANGLRLLFQGNEIYLEHLVVGPTGIFLVESATDSPLWRDDLARSIAFFIQNLGSASSHFTCLVVAREVEGADRLPPGAHLVDSLEAAIAVIQDDRIATPLPRTVGQEVWHIVEAMAARGPLVTASQPRRFGWREWVTIGAALGIDTIIMAYDPEFGFGEWLIGLFILVAPAAGLCWLTLLLPEGGWRKAASYSVMILALLLMLLMWIGAANPA